MRSSTAGDYRSPFFLFVLVVAFCHLLFDAGAASADSLGGLVDLTYSKSDGNTVNSAGATTENRLSSFSQKYRLTLSKSFFPNLNLTAGGIFEKTITDSNSAGRDTTSIDTKTRPFFDLRLSTPLYSAGVGYSRTEDEQKSSGSPSTTNVNERRYAILGWKPEGYPDWSVRLEKSDTFDKDRVHQDTSAKLAYVMVHYAYKNLDLRYQPSYSDQVDRVGDIEQINRTHSGRAKYSSSFFQGRTSLSGSYEATRGETEIIAGGAGEVSFPLIPLSGLSTLDDTPADGALDPNPILIDGNLTASAGLNLGLPPLGGDTRQRNMGLDFLIPPETNILYVWVNRELPSEISTAFIWEVYTSQNGTAWNRATTVAAAPFGPFQNRFEIRIPNVTSRYIKVVTRPLTAVVPRAAEFPDIFVTEIQAFLTRPADEVRGKTIRTTQAGTVDFRTRLLDRPSLYYDFSYNTVTVNPPSRTHSSMTNGVSASHVFSRMFSASGRASREDNRAEDRKDSAYAYTVSLQAVPLNTLRHVLLFTGRNEQSVEGPRDVYSLILQNTAELYKSIQVILNGGVTREKKGTGETQETENLLVGATFVPNRTLAVTLNFNGSWTDRTGGNRPDENTVDRRGDASISYRPFDTLYLLASVSRIEQPGIHDTVQNYGLNWSPFPSGALQFNFAFTQDLSARDNSKTRTVRPALRWNITSRIAFDLSYEDTMAESTAGTTDNKTFSTRLRIIL